MSLKSVEIVRKIRDENYQNCKNMTPQEKIEYTKKIAIKFSILHPRITFSKSQQSAISGLTIE